VQKVVTEIVIEIGRRIVDFISLRLLRSVDEILTDRERTCYRQLGAQQTCKSNEYRITGKQRC